MKRHYMCPVVRTIDIVTERMVAGSETGGPGANDQGNPGMSGSRRWRGRRGAEDDWDDEEED